MSFHILNKIQYLKIKNLFVELVYNLDTAHSNFIKLLKNLIYLYDFVNYQKFVNYQIVKF